MNKPSEEKLGLKFLDEMIQIRTLFRDFIISSEFCLGKNNELTWSQYKSGISRGLYSKEYIDLINKRQYSFLLKENKGFIQIYCSFEGDTITKAKMAFYPHPLYVMVEESELEDLLYDSDGDDSLSAYAYDMWEMLNSDIHGTEEESFDMISMKFMDKYPLTNSSHIRLDYDPSVLSHHVCEIQFGSINNIRLPVSKLIHPLLFVDFIIKNVYTKEHKDMCLNKKHPIHGIYKKIKSSGMVISKFNEENIFFTYQ